MRARGRYKKALELLPGLDGWHLDAFRLSANRRLLVVWRDMRTEPFTE